MPAPRRAISAKQLKPMGSTEAPLTGWAQMDGWGKPFDPFADNPLQRAFAADYRCNLQPPPIHNAPLAIRYKSRTLENKVASLPAGLHRPADCRLLWRQCK